MNIYEFDYNLEHGFAYIIIEGKNAEMIVQCCLKKEPDASFVKEIIRHDCGHDWGMCGDVNEQAFDYWGENRCMKALFDAAECAGFVLI